jgi:hypothetical protein
MPGKYDHLNDLAYAVHLGKWLLFVLALVLAAMVMLSSGCREKDRCPNGWRRIQIYESCIENVGSYSIVCASPDSKIEPAK